jgi:hypothetical protein
MPFAIVLAPEAVRAAEDKSQSYQTPGVRRPQYRLRVDEIRVFHDIAGSSVESRICSPIPPVVAPQSNQADTEFHKVHTEFRRESK